MEKEIKKATKILNKIRDVNFVLNSNEKTEYVSFIKNTIDKAKDSQIPFNKEYPSWDEDESLYAVKRDGKYLIIDDSDKVIAEINKYLSYDDIIGILRGIEDYE